MADVPKISILMPSLNVGSYIRQCLESVVNQTLEEIEILCIDAGSTDGTLEILQEYEKLDSRIKLIRSEKKSYGFQMNLGLDAAQGEYIGIVETDDWVEPNMFEVLWEAASHNHADMVRAGYFWYSTKPKESNVPISNVNDGQYRQILVPLQENRPLYNTAAIWSGIYRLDMLKENGIRFLESPGASYQDTSFYYCVCCVSKRAYYLEDLLLHYRIDNESSSVNSAEKVFCICDEMQFLEKYIRGHFNNADEILQQLLPIKMSKYLWNYYRLGPNYQWHFLQKFHQEFLEHQKKGQIKEYWFQEQEWYKPYLWADMNQIIKYPALFFLRTCKENATGLPGGKLLTNGFTKKVIKKYSYVKKRGLSYIWQKWNRGFNP